MTVIVNAAIIASILLAMAEIIDLLHRNLIFPGQEEGGASFPQEVADESLLNGTDRRRAEESRKLLEEALGENPVESLLTLNPEDRVRALSELTESLVRLYHVDIDSIEFSPYLPDCTAGCYRRERRLIQVNIKWLLSNQEEILLDLLDTVFHELRHAVQWSIIQDGGAYWDATEERREAFARNFRHYIPANRDLCAYQMQLVERDAVAFAAYALREVSLA